MIDRLIHTHNPIRWDRAIFICTALIFAYATILLYSEGETAFAILTLLLVTIGLYIFAKPEAYAYRYIYPGILGILVFIIFPLVYTINISYTNYSGTNRISMERAYTLLLEKVFLRDEKIYNFKTIKTTPTLGPQLMKPPHPLLCSQL